MPFALQPTGTLLPYPFRYASDVTGKWVEATSPFAHTPRPPPHDPPEDPPKEPIDDPPPWEPPPKEQPPEETANLHPFERVPALYFLRIRRIPRLPR